MMEISRSPNESGAKERKKEVSPIIVKWDTPFRLNTVILDLKDDRRGKLPGFGGYYHMYVPIIFEDDSARGTIRFVRKDPSWKDSGVLITGARVPDSEVGKQFVSTQVSLWLNGSIGLQDAHFIIQTPDGQEIFTTQRTSACGAVPKADPGNNFLYFSTGRSGPSGAVDPRTNLGLDNLYIPLSRKGNRLGQDLLFSLVKFPVDDLYYRRFPVMRNVLEQGHKPTISTS